MAAAATTDTLSRDDRRQLKLLQAQNDQLKASVQCLRAQIYDLNKQLDEANSHADDLATQLRVEQELHAAAATAGLGSNSEGAPAAAAVGAGTVPLHPRPPTNFSFGAAMPQTSNKR